MGSSISGRGARLWTIHHDEQVTHNVSQIRHFFEISRTQFYDVQINLYRIHLQKECQCCAVCLSYLLKRYNTIFVLLPTVF